MTGFAQPERAAGAKVEAVVAAIDLKGGGEASGPAGEIEKSSGIAATLHELDTFERFEGTNEDRRSGSGRLAHDIEHEVRAVVKKNVGVARGKIHRTNARSRPAEGMSSGVTGRIGFRFHDAAAEPARGEIVDDDSSDKEASEIDSVRGKVGAAETANREFRRRGFLNRVRWGHGMSGQRESGFWRSPEETRS